MEDNVNKQGTNQIDAKEKLNKVEDDEEEEEEEEEDKIIEKSHSGRFHKRNKRLPRQMEGVDNAFVAIEPKSGKEVIWNESFLPKQKTEKENRFLSVIKKLKKTSHPFLVRFLDAWITKGANDTRKMVFITERLDEGTLKQFLCNLSGSNKYWKRHISQLLSVVAHLHQMGVTHGLLNKENIYYQNTGSLKVGPFSLTDFFDQRKQPNDIYNIGMLALELAVWKLSAESQNLPISERTKEMLNLLEDEKQYDFVMSCLDPMANNRPRVIQLLNHVAVIDVPNLKLISAKLVVDNFCSGTTEDASTIFNRLLKDNLSHYEDDNVLIELQISGKEQTTHTWKDLKQNFSATAKFLEHVRNGFYTLPWQSIPSLAHINNPSNPLATEDEFSMVTNDKFQNYTTQISNCGTMNSTSNSTNNSRKNSSCNRNDYQYATPYVHNPPPGHIQAPHFQYAQQIQTIGFHSMSQFHGIPPSRDGTYPDCIQHKRLQLSEEDSLQTDREQIGSIWLTNDCSILETPDIPHLLQDYPNNENYMESLMPDNVMGFCDRDSFYTPLEFHQIGPTSITANFFESRDEFDESSNEFIQSYSAIQEQNLNKISTSNMETENFPDEDEEEFEDENDYFENHQSSISGNTVGTTGGQEFNSSDLVIVNNSEKIDFVSPPKEFSTTPALFSHCEYTYLGLGRWQLYVQVWFIEKKLKRDLFVQLFEEEWHKPFKVARLFEMSRCLAKEDKNTLLKLLTLARHNCPLVEGHLKCPQRFMKPDSEILYHRINALHLFELVRDLKRYDIQPDEKRFESSDKKCSLCSSSEDLFTKIPLDVEEKYDGSLANINQLLNLDTGSIGMLLDIGNLAPRNSACGNCDYHEYLHRNDLPPYLISPCYHCREAFAKEAKITPVELMDLHITRGIPWPGFFQVRFNLPKDAQHSVEELIEYDCKWRSRQPCKCFLSSNQQTNYNLLKPAENIVLPPCFEFYQPSEKTTSNTTSVYNSNNNPEEVINSSTPTSQAEEKHDTKPRHALPCHLRHNRGARHLCPHNVLIPPIFNRISQNNLQPLHIRTIPNSVSQSTPDLVQQCDQNILEDDPILNTPVDNNATATADNSKSLCQQLSQL